MDATLQTIDTTTPRGTTTTPSGSIIDEINKAKAKISDATSDAMKKNDIYMRLAETVDYVQNAINTRPVKLDKDTEDRLRKKLDDANGILADYLNSQNLNYTRAIDKEIKAMRS
jgi:hypothetical protein